MGACLKCSRGHLATHVSEEQSLPEAAVKHSEAPAPASSKKQFDVSRQGVPQPLAGTLIQNEKSVRIVAKSLAGDLVADSYVANFDITISALKRVITDVAKYDAFTSLELVHDVAGYLNVQEKSLTEYMAQHSCPASEVITVTVLVSRTSGYIVCGAGTNKFNGVYLRHGTFRGCPRYKHKYAEPPLYIRHGTFSKGISCFGISEGAESFPGKWAYYAAEFSDGLQEVPTEGWVTHGGMGAVAPAPSLTFSGVATTDDDEDGKDVPSAYLVKGAGATKFNGVYVRHGSFRGSPRYKHQNAEPQLFIRQGASPGGYQDSCFGISEGAERFPGRWAYYCPASLNKDGLSEIPLIGWITHGGMGAVEPAPTLSGLDRLA